MFWLGRSCKYLQFVRTLLKLAPISRKHLNLWSLKIKQYEVQHNSTYPDFGYPDRLGSSGKFVENSTKLTYLEITSYRINHSTVLWLLELRIRRGRKVQTQVHAVNSNSRTSSYQCSPFKKKKSGFSAYPDGWSSQLIRISGVLMFFRPLLLISGRASLDSLCFLIRVLLVRNEYGAMVE